MVPIGPLRDCQMIVAVHTAFLGSSSSFKLGVSHHFVTESSVAIFFACYRLALILFQLSLTRVSDPDPDPYPDPDPHGSALI
jgi:hypothetical protein